ncbi:MAG: class I SAM-dependent methyltransferase [Rhodospirillaceae bacterium]|jgi:ubiquinone/menaquinone biosynthesis C-methylase UbiE|nr:class I SAM-dependent methyltransferase [Rhodospirillaceae bacterium]MBT5565945.1 class I SAM-dependent methyltransferase [Rhodospirillaceae bacterium]MBT6088635.1 class I SAM-dependent methyltransferase [Rhodospirillaceae bacterium]MBT6961993.1 class I SAM-dependent methyltransferase [Rhodospirillaceae bacterium]
MLRQEPHAVLPQSSVNEQSRQDFLNQLGKHVLNEITPGNAAAYQKRVLPRIKTEKGRDPESRHEIRKEMVRDPYYQMTSSFQRTVQEMMWNSVDDTIQRQLPELIATAKTIRDGETLGSLNLEPGFEIPPYIAENDHHCMPGGYSGDLVDDDITAGALYDKGAFIYTQGLFGPRMDGIGRATALMTACSFPKLQPKKILEIGCTAGGSTTGLKMGFPDAEVHAIDVGPSVLRYAHARAESMGVAIHFHQMSGEALTFDDASFDLVNCPASFHEMSRSAVYNVFKEAFRVLKPGGVFLLSELPPYEGVDPWTQFVRDWDTYNNNEPFWGTLHEMNFAEVAETAGFDRADYWEGTGPGIAEANQLTGAVEVQNKKFMGSTRGGGQAWYAHMTKRAS